MVKAKLRQRKILFSHGLDELWDLRGEFGAVLDFGVENWA